MQTESSTGTQLLPLATQFLKGSASGHRENPAQAASGIPVSGNAGFGMPAEAMEALSRLSPLAAIGASLPPPSLLQASAVPAAAAMEEFPPETDSTRESTGADAAEGLGPEQELTEEQQAEVEELQARDREVRQHEQAHLAAAGGHARGGASYDYTTGPDGKRYATGGEVSIDTSKVSGDPQATIRKAQQIYRAALAPAEPSGQDRSVASQAKKMEMEARAELSEQRLEEAGGSTDEADASAAAQRPEESTTHGHDGSQQDAGHLLDLLG